VILVHRVPGYSAVGSRRIVVAAGGGPGPAPL